MGFTLTLSQQRASDAIKYRIVQCLKGDVDKKYTTFYAMTGAGKTVVMSKSIESVIDAYNGDVAFMWISPGDGSLHIQSFDKLRYNLRNDVKCTILDKTIRGTSRIGKNEIAVVNWEKINKKNNTLMEDGDYLGFPSICDNTREFSKLCLIIDESHINNTLNAQHLLDKVNPDVIVSMSATPSESPHVRISHEDLVNEEVVKKRVSINNGVEEFKEKNPDIDNLHVALICAYEQSLVLKESLRKEGSTLNPAILVQIPNMRKGAARIELTKEFFASKKVSEENNNLAVWVTKSKGETDVTMTTPGFDKEAFKDDDSPIDVLIFKQAISTGWDCQRAYVWVKLRDNMSEVFEVQTMGRVMRQPGRKYYDDDVLNVGYVYTDDDNFQVKPSKYEVQFIDWLPTRLKDNIRLSLTNYHRKWDDREVIARSTKESVGFQKVLINTFNNKFGIVDKEIYKNLDLLISKGYDVSTGILPSRMLGDSSLEASDIAKGTFRADAHKLDGKASSYEIEERFEDLVTQGLVVCEIAKNSYTNARGALIRWSIDYLGFPKGCHMDPLYSFFIRNWINLVEVFVKSLETYKVYRDKDRLNKLKNLPNEIPWELKTYRQFNDNTYEEVVYSKYVYNRCYLMKDRSKIERCFADVIDVHSAPEWWYKNGDGGKEHFSVYYEYENQYHLFHVDFIIKLKNGYTCIIDTKEDITLTGGDAIPKSIGLQKYIKDRQSKGEKIIGGIVTRNKIGKLKIWDKEGPYKLSDMLDDWENLDDIIK